MKTLRRSEDEEEENEPLKLLVFCAQAVGVCSKQKEAPEPSCFSTARVNVSDRLFHILTLDEGSTVSGNPAGPHLNEAAPP